MLNRKQTPYCNNIIVLGRQWRDGRFDPEPAQCLKEQIKKTVVISTPDASNLNDTHMLDLMALTNPGPHLFLVVLEEGKQPEGELGKWKEVFGENISHDIIYVTDGCYDNSRISGKCISIKDDIIKQCKHINKDRHTTYSFREFLNKRKQNIYKTAAETDQDVTGGKRKRRQLTLVLLGESGSGKSASGNTILGETAFKSEPSSMPVTTKCETWTKSVCGTEVTVIDTPDFFDDDLQEPRRHIQTCRELCEGGLCVYLLAIQIGRFTEGERDILERLEKALETTVRDRTIILFTRGDDLRSKIDAYVRDTNPFLQELIKNCGKRYQVFNNTILVTQQQNEKGGISGWIRNQLVRSVVVSDTASHQTEVEKQVKELMDKTDLFSLNCCDDVRD